MQTKFIFTAIVALMALTNVNAQTSGRIKAKKPSNFSWGATNGQSQGNGLKLDSLHMKSPASSTTQRKRKTKPNVKLDDLKDPFDSTKVKMEPRKPLQNN